MKNDRVGEIFINNQGDTFVIVEYHGSQNVIVEFQDKYHYRVKANYYDCKRGQVKNVYHPTHSGVGFLGLCADGSKPIVSVKGKATREYILWRDIIQRCYDTNFQAIAKTYVDVTVCDRWLCFANFLEDLPKIENYEMWFNNPNQRIALDKDLKQVGVENKVYSLDTVMFITISSNNKEMQHRRKKRSA